MNFFKILLNSFILLDLTLFSLRASPEVSDSKAAAQVINEKIPNFWEQDRLTGDWDGVRTRLEDKGVAFYAKYTVDLLDNTRGGVRSALGESGVLDFGVYLGTKKLLDWEGGLFHVNSYWLHGDDPSFNVNDYTGLSSVQGRDTLKLYELWYEQSVWEDRLSVRFGQMAIDQEFATSAIGATFINATFGYPTVISKFAPHPQYPSAGLGARVRLEPKLAAAPGFYFQTGVFEGNPDDVGDKGFNDTGTKYSLDDGVVGTFELGYNLDNEHGWKGLPGQYKVGSYYHTISNDVSTTFLNLAEQTGNSENYVIYGMAEQMIYKVHPETSDSNNDLKGIQVFAHVVTAPSALNQVHFYTAAGATYTGLIPSRDKDVLGLAVAYAKQSNGSRQFNTLSDGVTPSFDHETSVEATYLVPLNAWWTVQPDLQYIFNPNFGIDPAQQRTPGDAVVIGARTTLNF